MPVSSPELGAETVDVSRTGESSSKGEGSPRARSSSAAVGGSVKTDASGVSGATSDENRYPYVAS